MSTRSTRGAVWGIAAAGVLVGTLAGCGTATEAAAPATATVTVTSSPAAREGGATAGHGDPAPSGSRGGPEREATSTRTADDSGGERGTGEPGRSSGADGSGAGTTPRPTATAPAMPRATATPAPGRTCADLDGRAAVRRSFDTVPEYAFGPGPDDTYPWDPEWADVSGYDPCAPLSWIILPIRGGTASSPYQIMLFHQGRYLGTTTSAGYGFEPRVTRLSPERIAVVYVYARPGEGTANASGRARSTFTWDAARQKVVHAGELPPDDEE